MVVDSCLYAWGWAIHITLDYEYMVWRIHINIAVKKYQNTYLCIFFNSGRSDGPVPDKLQHQDLRLTYK